MHTLVNEHKIAFFRNGDELPSKQNCIWLIVDGVVKTFSITESGTAITLGFWGNRDVVGMSLSTIAPYKIRCMSNVRAIAIAQNQQATITIECIYHQQQTQQLMYIIRHTNRVAKRLWLFLTWLGGKFGRTTPEGKLIDFKLTHQELAEAIGATRITVTKTLNQFEKEGFILRPKTRCIILRA